MASWVDEVAGIHTGIHSGQHTSQSSWEWDPAQHTHGVLTAGQAAAVDRWHPQVGGAGVEQDLEALGWCPEADLAKVGSLGTTEWLSAPEQPGTQAASQVEQLREPA